ncbi:Rieske (2Fe-2S) protein [Spirillospora sp. NPDC047279]|uniref:Rieske (2Fe-2S) protein n=1 Tax=Spirillospora sp. NPDC047279 TaxID=3155478 RepID=UPI00340B6431
MVMEPAPHAENVDVDGRPAPADPGTDPGTGSSRRGLLIGVGLAGVAGLAVACGGDDDSGGDGSGGGSGGGAGEGSGGGTGGGTVLAQTSAVPVGGGTFVKAQKIVVTQPTQGTFKAFSAVCTHRKCDTDEISGGTINCPCHGSKFKVADGSVAAGPATEPLEEKQITVEGGQIKLA